MTMTIQEIFDAAIAGLASQNFERCFDDGCRYTIAREDGIVIHCAWGWVDQSLPSAEVRDLTSLCRDRVGIAGTLGVEEMRFAARLQSTHDAPEELMANPMKDRLLWLGREYNLVIPSVLTDACNTPGEKA